MIQLLKNGAYVLNGTEILEDSIENKSVLEKN